ncbi:hypothetical protein HK405_003351 [Cladochytrium tenue]|nr:hypothetical protein HK405_003351 [Cladochytrium tenue]
MSITSGGDAGGGVGGVGCSTRAGIAVLVQLGEFVGHDLFQRGLYALKCRAYAPRTAAATAAAAASPPALAADTARVDAVPVAVFFDADLRRACHPRDRRYARFASPLPTTASSAVAGAVATSSTAVAAGADASSAAAGVEARRRALAATFEAPTFKMAAPTPEHYAPVLVAAGAGAADAGVVVNEGWDTMTFSFSDDSYRFGAEPVGTPSGDAPAAAAAS